MRVHGEIPGRTFLGEVHPVGAPTKTLISNTADLVTKFLVESTNSFNRPGKLQPDRALIPTAGVPTWQGTWNNINRVTG